MGHFLDFLKIEKINIWNIFATLVIICNSQTKYSNTSCNNNNFNCINIICYLQHHL